MSYPTLATRLLSWFDQFGRKNLPWQQHINPYRVWVSEIMLQQTQVTTVIPYFERFMSTFPTLESLAIASQDQVLHLWTGLGYYSRARNLHKTAQIIHRDHGGEFPNTLDQLTSLPGIGKSTAGAILAIAFKQHATILDGNVKRVLARHFAVEGWPGESAVHKSLWQIAERQTPKTRVADYTQAIMDLGATLCTRTKPECPACPLSDTCQGYQQGEPTQYPGTKPRKNLPIKQSLFAIFVNPEGHMLLEKRLSKGLWGGLWAFPTIDLQELESPEQRISQLAAQYHCQIVTTTLLEPRRHSFSHFHLDFTPAVIKTSQKAGVSENQNLLWYNPEQPSTIGTPAPVQKLLKTLKAEKAIL